MNAIDTNVLVRFLVCDDQSMTERARRIFEHARDESEPLLVTTLVLLETLWVLRSFYDFSRDAIIDAVKKLGALHAISFESQSVLYSFIEEAASVNTDLAGILIGLQAKAAGPETTMTFDRKAAKNALFTEMPP